MIPRRRNRITVQDLISFDMNPEIGNLAMEKYLAALTSFNADTDKDLKRTEMWCAVSDVTFSVVTFCNGKSLSLVPYTSLLLQCVAFVVDAVFVFLSSCFKHNPCDSRWIDGIHAGAALLLMLDSCLTNTHWTISLRNLLLTTFAILQRDNRRCSKKQAFYRDERVDDLIKRHVQQRHEVLMAQHRNASFT